MSVGGRPGRGRRGVAGAPRRRLPESRPSAADRIRWLGVGALGGALVVGLTLLVAGQLDGDRGDPVGGARAAVARAVTEDVDAALAPLGARTSAGSLGAPAAFGEALDAATDDAGVVRAAAAGEGLLALLLPAHDAIAAIDVPGAVRGRGLDEGFVVDLIDARQRLLDALDLYRAAARLVAEAALIEEPSLGAILATARDLVDQADALLADGQDLLVEAQVAAGTYVGPLGGGAIGLDQGGR